MNKYLSMMGVALASLLLVGCDATDNDWAAANAQTQASFSNPKEVGKLPDGRTVFVVERIIPQKHDHVIYSVFMTFDCFSCPV